MADKCCVCGKTLSKLMDIGKPYDKERFPDVLLCERCISDLNAIRTRTVAKNSFGIQGFSEKVGAFKNNVQRNMTNPTARNELLSLIDKTNGGHSTFIEYHKASLAKLFPEKSSHYFGKCFVVNQENKTFATREASGLLGVVHQFEDLIDFSVNEDGNSVTSGRSGAAVAGALLAGAAGAIVGSAASKKTTQMVNQLEIVLSYKGLDAPLEVISLIYEPVEKGSKKYGAQMQLCNQIVSALKQILDDNDKVGEKAERGARAIYAFSVADEILKFKQLADDGVITQAEFEAQKQKLLSLDY